MGHLEVRDGVVVGGGDVLPQALELKDGVWLRQLGEEHRARRRGLLLVEAGGGGGGQVGALGFDLGGVDLLHDHGDAVVQHGVAAQVDRGEDGGEQRVELHQASVVDALRVRHLHRFAQLGEAFSNVLPALDVTEDAREGGQLALVLHGAR